jgi:hypothetical protein
LIELLIATAVMLAMTSAVMTLLHESLVRTPLLEDAADLHQRARVASDAITADLRAAGNGTSRGPLSAVVPGVEPRRVAASAGSASAGALTVRYVPPHGARARLSQPLEPASTLVVLDSTGCPQSTTACGFTTGVRAIVFDPSGQMDAFEVEAIGPGVLVLSASASRLVTYAAGSELAQFVEVSYALDTVTRQLRRSEGGGTFTLVDNVESLTFEYFGDTLAAIPLSTLEDGPFRGSGARMFDADLLGVRAVKASMRFAAGNARSPGLSATFIVSLRAGG